MNTAVPIYKQFESAVLIHQPETNPVLVEILNCHDLDQVAIAHALLHSARDVPEVAFGNHV